MTVTFPETTPHHYLTGKTALNIPFESEGGGDWHFREAFFGRGDRLPIFFLAGEGEELNTNTIFQDFGIFERSEVLRNKGVPLPNSLPVYTANHYRAVLDMLYRWISDNQYPAHLEIDAWFDTPEQIAYLMEKTKALYPFLTPTQQTLLTRWIESNTPR